MARVSGGWGRFSSFHSRAAFVRGFLDRAKGLRKNLFSVTPFRRVSGVRSVRKRLEAPYLPGIVTYSHSVGNCKSGKDNKKILINQLLESMFTYSQKLYAKNCRPTFDLQFWRSSIP
jgi:hypothetical protein